MLLYPRRASFILFIFWFPSLHYVCCLISLGRGEMFPCCCVAFLCVYKTENVEIKYFKKVLKEGKLLIIYRNTVKLSTFSPPLSVTLFLSTHTRTHTPWKMLQHLFLSSVLTVVLIMHAGGIFGWLVNVYFLCVCVILYLLTY